MKKNTLLIWLIILIIIGVSIGLYFWQKNQLKEEIGLGDETAIRLLIEEFGQKLKSVSLQAPQEIVAQSIEENYKDFVTPELLSLWQNNPSFAPGRITSSPWPERIEIDEIQKIDENNYLVKGRIIEITSVEVIEGGAAAEREVEITVEKVNGKWLISNLVLKPYSSKEEVGATEYRNSALGIRFEYPENFIPYLKDNEYLGDQPSRFVMGKDSAAPLNGNPYFVIMLSGVKGYYICPSLEDAKMSYSGSYEDIQKFIQEGKPIKMEDCEETTQTIDQVAENSAFHHLSPFGENPIIENLEINGQQARLIYSPDDGNNESELIVELKTPVFLNNNYWSFVVIHVSNDVSQQVMKTIIQSFNFI